MARRTSGKYASNLPAAGRTIRRPQHPFYCFTRPFEISPMFIAPVLPGETMKNLLIQARVVTDPINNPLIGWWQEFYFFYVKLRDLAGRADFTEMHINPSLSLAAYQQGAVDYWRATPAGGIKWVDQCLTRVVDTYFRDEGEVASDRVITAGKPAAQWNTNSWMDSLQLESTFDASDQELLDISALTTYSGGDDKLMASELDTAMRQWEFLRANNLVNMEYEDYLKTFGIKVPGVEQHKPELVRYLREWQYPSNTIDPTNGVARSAVSWSIADRADKDRFFTEPGFLFGVSLTRPKVYSSKQKGAAASFLDNAYMWLPAMLADDPATSLREFALGTGPLPDTTSAYRVDMKDLFIYGEQYTNINPATQDINVASLPTNGITNARYPTATDVDALFVVDGTPGTSGVDNYRVRMDGIISVSIASRQYDTSLRGGVNVVP